MKKLDLKNQETVAYIIVGCTAVTILVLLVDMQIARALLKRADELDAKIREGERAVKASHGNSSSAAIFRDFSRSHLVGNTGVETKADSSENSGDDIEPSPWDEFPLSRTNPSPGIRSVEVPQNGGSGGE